MHTDKHDDEKKGADGAIRKTTLAENGAMLPIGIGGPSGGSFRDIEVRPWRFKEERELGELRERHAENGMGAYISVVLMKMLTRLGSHDFTDPKLKDAEKRMIVGQLYLADIYYAYCWLRVQALGGDLEFTIRCKRCREEFDWFADLLSLEVGVVDDLEKSRWWYELSTPLEIRGQTVKRLEMGPTRWSDVESAAGKAGQANIGMMKFAAIKGSIHGIEGLGNVPLADHELDDMTKLDVEKLSSEIDRYPVGPDMAVEGSCPSCSAAFRTSIDWGYDSFFGVSSR